MTTRDLADGSWSRVLAPAKVNLRLDVLGRREDGFHGLETLMLAVGLYDEVAARRHTGTGLRLTVEGEFASGDVPCDERNLAWQSGQAALEQLQPGAGIELVLEKNIPSRAGLGGASSDAAAALLAVELALGGSLDAAWKNEFLGRLGSDCVFFEEARSTGLAWCEGRGEKVQPLVQEADDWTIALVTPAAECPTAAVFGALEFPLSAPFARPTVPQMIRTPAAAVRSWLFNHLESAAQAAVPEMTTWREALDAAGADHFRLSGSGSSYFGVFASKEEAGATLDAIRKSAADRQLGIRGTWVTGPAHSGIRTLQGDH